MTLPLQKWQRDGANFSLKNNYNILAMGPGTGKTLTALAAWSKREDRLLIVCPSYLIFNWKLEVAKWFGDRYVVEVFTEGKKIYHLWDTEIAIVSYDLSLKAENFFEWADTVISDEGHVLKSMKAKRTEYIHRVVFENSIKRLSLLTGTPIQNRVEEFYSLIALCHYNPELGDSPFLKEFPDSMAFADTFSHRHQFEMQVITKKGRKVQIPVIKWAGFKNVDRLKKILEPIYFRVSTDVLGLKPIIFKNILMSEIPDLELKELFDKLSGHYESDAGKTISVQRKVESAIEKVPFTYKYIKAVRDGERVPILVYTDHVESCEMLAAKFDVPALHGGASKKKRQDTVAAFQAGEIDEICATYGALSTGVTATRSNKFFANDKPWVPGVYDQAIHRIHRMTQEKQCEVHNIYGSPQDMRIGESMAEKNLVIRAVT